MAKPGVFIKEVNEISVLTLKCQEFNVRSVSKIRKQTIGSVI